MSCLVDPHMKQRLQFFTCYSLMDKSAQEMMKFQIISPYKTIFSGQINYLFRIRLNLVTELALDTSTSCYLRAVSKQSHISKAQFFKQNQARLIRLHRAESNPRRTSLEKLQCTWLSHIKVYIILKHALRRWQYSLYNHNNAKDNEWD